MKNFFYALLLVLAMSPIFLIADVVSVALRHPSVRQLIGVIKHTPSVSSMGYDPLQSNSTVSSLNSRNFSAYKSFLLKGTQNATPAMPLYLNTGEVRVRGLPRNTRILFFGTKDGYFEAYNLDTAETIWSLPLPEGLVVSTSAVMDAEKDKIYFLAQGKKAVPRIFLASLDGKQSNSREVLLDDESTLTCPTPLGLGSEKNPSLYFQCKTVKDKTYAFLLPIEKNGDLNTAKDFSLYADANDQASVAFADGSFLVSTSGENRCIRRLDNKLQQAVTTDAYLCDDNNSILFTPATISSAKKQQSFALSAAGQLYAFDPNLMPGPNLQKKSSLQLPGIANSSIPIFSVRRGESRTIVSYANENWHLDSFVANQEQNMRSIWNYTGDKEEVLTENTPLVLQNRQQALYLLLTKNKSPGEPFTHLLFFDAIRGKLLQDLPFAGDTQNTMPLAVDEEVYVATKNLGIVLLSRNPSFQKLFRESSYFQPLWRNLFAKLSHLW